jgi:integrase
VKLTETAAAPQWLTEDQLAAAIGAVARQRDRLMLLLLAETGVRIGEALGLRREDMHLLASSKALNCAIAGPHLHVQRRMNANGALAKCRFPRSIPVTEQLVDLYADYQHERSSTDGADASDLVFVNLYRPPIGEPVRYHNVKKLFDRISNHVGHRVRPHMFRHSAATRWIASGTPRDVVQALLGHVSPASMQVYLHPTDAAKSAAVERVAAATQVHQ